MRRFSLLVFLLSCIFFLSSPAFADTTYRVKKGDSLYKISKKFGISIDKIKTRNEITSSRLHPGTELSIPAGDKSENSGKATQRTIATTEQETPLTMSENAACFHIVEKGDSLSTISKKYSVSVRDIREFNHLRSTRIKPGQRLLLRETTLVEQPRKYDSGVLYFQRVGFLGAISLGAAALILLPILAVMASLLGPAGVTWVHLARTSLGGYVLNTALLAACVAAGVLSIGVLSAWLVTAYRFPGQSVLEGALVLPLAMPAYVMAYAYTDWLQFTGPVQGLLRAATVWQAREYWFPDIRSIPGAAAMLSFALYPYVYLLARTALLDVSRSALEEGRLAGYSAWGSFSPVSRAKRIFAASARSSMSSPAGEERTCSTMPSSIPPPLRRQHRSASAFLRADVSSVTRGKGSGAADPARTAA